jgi:hypothetical protein
MYSLNFLILELENARRALLRVFEVSNGIPNRARHNSHLRIGCAESGSLNERSGIQAEARPDVDVHFRNAGSPDSELSNWELFDIKGLSRARGVNTSREQ